MTATKSDIKALSISNLIHSSSYYYNHIPCKPDDILDHDLDLTLRIELLGQ